MEVLNIVFDPYGRLWLEEVRRGECGRDKDAQARHLKTEIKLWDTDKTFQIFKQWMYI